MAKILTLVLAVVMISVFSSTREGREEARAKLRPYSYVVGAITVLVWVWIICG